MRDEHGQILVDETLKAFNRVADQILPARNRAGHMNLNMFDDPPMQPATGAPIPTDFQGQQDATPGGAC